MGHLVSDSLSPLAVAWMCAARVACAVCVCEVCGSLDCDGLQAGQQMLPVTGLSTRWWRL